MMNPSFQVGLSMIVPICLPLAVTNTE